MPTTCLVRATTQEEGRRRLCEAMVSYGLNADIASSSCVHIVCGDLEGPHLGLGREPFYQLALSKNWIVIHNGARVHGTKPYELLYAANVQGTCAMINFAAAARQARFVYVSTIGIMAGAVEEQEHVSSAPLDQLSGYAQTKYVAERVAWLYGGTAAVLRLGSISGPNANDGLNLLLKGIDTLGIVCLQCIPPVFPVVSVRATALAIVKTAVERVESPHRVFHLVAQTPLLAENVFSHIKHVDAETFMQKLREVDKEPTHPLYSIRDTLRPRPVQSEKHSGCDDHISNLLGDAWTKERVSVQDFWSSALHDKRHAK